MMTDDLKMSGIWFEDSHALVTNAPVALEDFDNVRITRRAYIWMGMLT